MSQILLKEIFDDAFGVGWDADTVHGASLNALYDALTGGAVLHNWLGGKQGGTTAEYYHLTQAQHTIATQAATDSLSGYMTAIAQTFGGVKTFNALINTLGGIANSAAALLINDDAAQNVGLFGSAASGETPSLSVSGFFAADALRVVTQGIVAADTYGFEGANVYRLKGHGGLRVEEDGNTRAFVIIPPVGGGHGKFGSSNSGGFDLIVRDDRNIFYGAENTGIVFNTDGRADHDLRVMGDTETHLFFVDAGSQRVAIGGVVLTNEADLVLRKDGVLALAETTTPTADADYAKLYAKADDNPYWQDGAGAEHQLAYAGAAPAAHAASHVAGDLIQAAGAAQSGLMTSAAQTIGGIKTFNANILPVASIVFQTGATSLDLATNGARFLPRRVAQDTQPTPASGELMMWYRATGGRVRLVYNDPVAGVKSVQLG